MDGDGARGCDLVGDRDRGDAVRHEPEARRADLGQQRVRCAVRRDAVVRAGLGVEHDDAQRGLAVLAPQHRQRSLLDHALDLGQASRRRQTAREQMLGGHEVEAAAVSDVAEQPRPGHDQAGRAERGDLPGREPIHGPLRLAEHRVPGREAGRHLGAGGSQGAGRRVGRARRIRRTPSGPAERAEQNQ